MSDLNLSEKQLAVINKESLNAIREFEDALRLKHKEISQEETNPNHVKDKAGMDYVDFPYMKNKVNEHYPVWSFRDLKIVHEMLNSGWVVVQGELHFIDEGVPRIGACAAAHRIAFKKGMERTPENIVDLGNDVKAAVTDAMKKGFNTYMNISDDIYRHIEVVDLTENQKQILYDLAAECKKEDQSKFYKYIDNQTTNSNFRSTAIRLLKAVYRAKVNDSDSELSESDIESLINEYKQQLIDEFDISFD